MFGLGFFGYEAIELAAPTSQGDNEVQRRRRQTRRPRAKNIRLTRRASLSCAFCPSCQSAAGVRACPRRVKMSSRDRTCQRPPSYFAWGCFRYFGYEGRVGHAAGRPGRSSRPRRHTDIAAPTRLFAPPREEEEQERSVALPLFWRCGVVSFSSKTIAVVLTATNRQRFGPRVVGVTQGSGNVDSQHQVRSSGRGGQHGSYPRDSGCIAAHPADWRASAS
jgi:hypothetical protein